ncbi:hypothetical protein Poly21_13970 [Allorhodopirellula heiligendammensis]|uniref:Uncharacterized protein n=1 Tax=Allorhodopirellula heiligendammensis TaxID=2714739 RepID=A0A5C6C6X6_9BACT|nr:hypothetical protein Poly21_13970 [Allorhodopirellula heiligendammensis]
MSVAPRHCNQIRYLSRRRKRVTLAVRSEFIPAHISALAATVQPTTSKPFDLLQEHHQLRPIVIDRVVLIVPSYFRVELLPDFALPLNEYRVKPLFHILQLLSQFLPRSSPCQFKFACAADAAVMSETEEVKSAWTPFAMTGGIPRSETSKTKQLRLLLCNLQRKPAQPFRQYRLECPCIGFVLKTANEIIRIPRRESHPLVFKLFPVRTCIRWFAVS